MTIETIGDTLLRIWKKQITDRVVVNAEFLHYDTGRNGPRNFTTLSWEIAEIKWDLNELILNASIDVARNENPTPELLTFNSANIRYEKVGGGIDLSRAKSMASTLTRITNKLDKQNSEVGYPNYFHDHVYRVAKIVGAKSIMSLKGHDYGWYDQNTYRYIDVTVPNIRWEINRLLSKQD